jgi:diketogulonate reductase-like aldo/keto reductase
MNERFIVDEIYTTESGRDMKVLKRVGARVELCFLDTYVIHIGTATKIRRSGDMMETMEISEADGSIYS